MVISKDDENLLLDIIRLHDEAFDHAMLEDGHHKSDEGCVSLIFTNRFDVDRDTRPLKIQWVTLYSYVLGPSRLHWFNNVKDAHKAMTEWHAAEMKSEESW